MGLVHNNHCNVTYFKIFVIYFAISVMFNEEPDKNNWGYFEQYNFLFDEMDLYFVKNGDPNHVQNLTANNGE